VSRSRSVSEPCCPARSPDHDAETFYYVAVVSPPMGRQSQQTFISWQIAWMVGTILLLSTLGEFTLELFTVASLVGFLAIIEFTARDGVTPDWRARLKWFVLLGLLLFGYIIARRVLDILPSV
jgi:hypothetical protein